MTERLAQLSAAEIGRLLLGGATDAVAVTDHFLDAIERAADLNIFISMTADRAREEAEASRKRYREGRPLGPLDGVPLAWKDLFDVAGSRTTAGSDLFRDSPVAERDAPVVANLAAAGMVSLGKVNLSEFAFSGLGLNPHFGTPANPHDPEVPRAPGGSSSGSAVAVARGLCPCSIGSDTGGSVRIPAAFNGVVGHKTSEGRIDKRQVFPLSYTLDTVGPLCRSVEDAILIDLAMRGEVVSAVRRAPLSALTLLVPTNQVFESMEDAVGGNFEAALDRLAQAGAKVNRRPLPLLDDMVDLFSKHGSLTAVEAYHFHRDRMESELRERVDRRVVARIMGGKKMSSYDLVATLEARKRMLATFQAELGDALLVMPTSPTVAPEIAPLEADDELFHKVNLRTLRNTMFGNFLATCGLALPSGTGGNGLPTSILFSSSQGRDEHLLSFGLAIEKVLKGD